jgi:hypothetical protein
MIKREWHFKELCKLVHIPCGGERVKAVHVTPTPKHAPFAPFPLAITFLSHPHRLTLTPAYNTTAFNPLPSPSASLSHRRSFCPRKGNLSYAVRLPRKTETPPPSHLEDEYPKFPRYPANDRNHGDLNEPQEGRKDDRGMSTSWGRAEEGVGRVWAMVEKDK